MSPPFVLFGPAHLAALALVASGPLTLLWLLRRWPRLAGPWRQIMLVLLLSYGACIYSLRWTTLSWADCLPLHVCDLELVLLAAALAHPRPGLVNLVYYWGLAGAVPALLTPDLLVGFPSPWFLVFFLGHGAIVLAVATVVLVCPHRPNRPARAWLALLAYVLVVGLLDWGTGWNYGYLLRPPAGDTPVSRMGPWPWYIGLALLLAGALFGLLSWPWRTGVAPKAR